MIASIRFFRLEPVTPDTQAERRLDIEFANVQDSFGVDLGLAALPQHFFVAGAFAFFDQARADPPDQRMKPENAFDHHVNRRSQVVAAAYVT